ncbi:MAG TPA: MerR family DNA-binding transcriptional regulator [Anaeromyxobacter sp.]|nr:MerR family DNA-binding transcriptional regulator [Anaeromyxobacter sp.]
MSRHLRSTEIARLLGVSVATVKRWTDSGLLPADRTAGGHRRFSPAVVERVASQLAGKDAQVEQWLHLLVGPEGRLAVDAALLAERSRANGWEAVAAFLGRVLVVLGDRWQAGRLGVGDEHVASARLARALARVCDPLPVRPGAPRVVLATVEGEAHSLGLALVELCMRERGWETLWVGPDTPTDALARHLEATSVEVLALSASVERDAAGLRLVSTRLGELCARRGVALIAGGRGPWPDPLPFGELIREFAELGVWIDSFGRHRPRSRGPMARRRGPGDGHAE